MFERWNSLSLARQFVLAGIAVSLLAMALVGTLVAGIIERTYIRQTAAATALYVDSIIAPILPDLRTTMQIDGIIGQSLDETLDAGKLGERLELFRLWRGDGTILYSSRPELTGRRFPLNEKLSRGFSGEIVAEYGQRDDHSGGIDTSLLEPLLEIYSPVLQPWTGEVVAVSEFHERVPDLGRELWTARIRGWGAVALVTLGLFITLAAIVLRGSSIIEAQRMALKQRVEDLARLAAKNEALAKRVQDASHRATTFNERYLRRLGADLHDGPAQLIAFAALRLGSGQLRRGLSSAGSGPGEIETIRESLAEAMEEIRTISSGLAIPHVDTADVGEVIGAAVEPHVRRFGARISVETSGDSPSLAGDAKICVFRFVQEALTNAIRHGGPDCNISVRQRLKGRSLIIEVADDGGGFEPEKVPRDRLGLACLHQRVEGVGGMLEVASSRQGTCVMMTLRVQPQERPRWAA